MSQLENVAHRDPKVAVFPDGGFVVVWTVGPPDLVGRWVIHARFFKKDGSPAGGQFRLVDRAGESQVVNQVAAAPDGSFLVVWTEKAAGKSNIIVRRFDRDGTPRGSRIQANEPHKSRRYNGVIAVGADGRFAVAWSADVDLKPFYRSYGNAVARIFNAQGTPLTREFIVGEGAPGIGDDNIYSDPVALGLGPDGSLTVQLQDLALPDVYQNYVKRFNSKGKPRRFFVLSSPVSCCVDAPGGFLGMGSDGSAVATWSEWELKARRFAPNGAPKGSPFWVSKAPESWQRAPSVALVAGGTSVIVWEEGERDGDQGGIFGRAFAANGAPLSNDFQVNSTSAGWQYGPAIAAAGQGAVVVWMAPEGIFARRLAPEP